MSKGLYNLILAGMAIAAAVVLLALQVPVPAMVLDALAFAVGWSLKTPGDMLSGAGNP